MSREFKNVRQRWCRDCWFSFLVRLGSCRMCTEEHYWDNLRVAMGETGMITLRRQHMQDALNACIRVIKSAEGEFSAKWLRDTGTPIHAKTLAELCELGCLSFRAN